MFSLHQGTSAKEDSDRTHHDSHSESTNTDTSESEGTKRKKRKWSKSSSEERKTRRLSAPIIKRARLSRTPERCKEREMPKTEPRKVKLSSLSSNAKRREDRARRFSDMLESTQKVRRRSYQCAAAIPTDRDKPGWLDTHYGYSKMVLRTPCKVLLLGDSMIKGLARYPSVWRKYFAGLGALNFGIGGDRTQHVLWRIQNGELEFKPQIVVIHVGTNNVNQDPAEDIVQGLLAIVDFTLAKIPDVSVIVTGLLPRDLYPSFRRKKIDEVNANLEEMIDFSDDSKYESVFFLKPESDWVLEGGLLDETLYHTDYLHLIEAGDEKFAKAIVDLVKDVKDGCKKKEKKVE